MYPVELTLLRAGGGPPAAAEAHAVQDALWAHSRPGDGLEHARARALPDGIGLVLYIRAPGQAAARARAYGLLCRSLTSTTLTGLCVARPY